MQSTQLETYEDDKRHPLRPVWSYDGFKTEKGFMAFHSYSVPILEDIYEERIKRHLTNLLWYTGEYDSNSEYRFLTPARASTPISQYTVPVVINHLYELTEQRVSRLSVYKPNFDVAPHNDEEEDRVSSRHMKTMIEIVRRGNGLDSTIMDGDRWNCVFGEEWISIEWDPNAGPRGKNGKPLGDVVISLKEPFWIMPEPRRDFRKCRYIYEIYDIMHVEEVRKKWNKPELEPDRLSTVWSWSDDDSKEKSDEEIIIHRFLYKPDEFIPEGMEVLVAGNTILEMNTDKWRYSHNDFPYERNTDIDVPGRMNPISMYHYLIPVQHQYNKMTSMIHRNITLAAHPKWMMTKGACNKESLGNAATIVEHAPGVTPPQLVSFNTVPGDVFNYRTSLRQEMGVLGATQGVSIGQPPPNARSGSMLKFYEDQEMQRNGTTIDKRNDLIKRIYTKVGGVVQDFYPNSPERVVRAIGRSNSYDLIRLSEVKIASPFDVEIQNSTGFSESRSGRLEEVSFAMEKLPGILSNRQAADVLGWANPQKFYDTATAALTEAETENSNFLSGRPVAPPEVWEDHVTHRETHLIQMQHGCFKRLPKALRKAMTDHVQLTEELMCEAANKNPTYAQALLALPDFPRFADPGLLTPVAAPVPSNGPGQPAGGPGPAGAQGGQAASGGAGSPEPPSAQDTQNPAPVSGNAYTM